MIVWLAGNVTDASDGTIENSVASWEIIGVFESRDVAIVACHDETCFIAPFILNDISPRECCLIPNCEYPLAKTDEAEVTDQSTKD